MNDLSSAHHIDVRFLHKFLCKKLLHSCALLKGTSVSKYVGGLNGKVELQDAYSVT